MESELLLNVSDYARAASHKLPKGVWDYYGGGALGEITLRQNTAAWEGLKLYYHVLAGVGTRDITTTVLKQPISLPIAIAPTAFHRLACEGGENAPPNNGKAGGPLFI